MSSTPRLNRFLFIGFLILSLCVGLAALIWPSVRSLAYAPLRDSLLPNFYLNPQAGKPVRLLVAAPPVLEEWIRDSATEFSRQNPLISIEMTVLRGADANRRLNAMTGLPDIWIAEADWARTAAGGIPYQTKGSVVAQDLFTWAIPSNGRLQGISILNWRAMAQTASADPKFRLGVPPAGSVEGMGGCLSAAAEYFQTDTVTAAQINDNSFLRWLAGLLEAVPDLTRNPLDQITSRPPQVDAAFLTLSDKHSMNQEDFLFQVLQRPVVLNYTLYIRSTWNEFSDAEADSRREAAGILLAFLTGTKVQDGLAAYGLTHAGADLDLRVRPADDAAVYALQFCWRHQGG